MKNYPIYFIVGILIFHIGAASYATLTFPKEIDSLSIFHAYPIGLWLFTLTWTGIVFRKKWCMFVYFTMMMIELLNRLLFRGTEYAKVLGDILFPIDLIFAFVILILYRLHFHHKENK